MKAVIIVNNLIESLVYHMIIKELNFPVIYHNDIKIGYGGNQDWFQGKWQRKAGCGSTSGTNIVAYYAANIQTMKHIYKGNTESFNQAEFVNAMEEMYGYMTPGPFGFPYVKKFADQFVIFCKDRGITLRPHILEKYKTKEEAFDFVKNNIDKQIPIALLILFHRAPELREDNWHWVTITGYEQENDVRELSSVIMSNCGVRQKVKGDILFEVHPKNTLSMIAFEN
ncbi:MAG: hypothetical protein K0R92_1158 [Lachnospiraceae bacterium]|jgi:hypothetical protein|nr:hypothetical protein [Lachnospiraceae bacterium]